MSGVQHGREDNGNLLGKFTEALTPDKSRGYGIFSFATEESEGSDPIVLTIDPASKQVSALTTDVEVPVADFTVNKIVGALAAYYADGTTITKQSGTTSAASAAKVQGVRTKIPFSSVRVPAHIARQPWSPDERHIRQEQRQHEPRRPHVKREDGEMRAAAETDRPPRRFQNPRKPPGFEITDAYCSTRPDTVRATVSGSVVQ